MLPAPFLFGDSFHFRLFFFLLFSFVLDFDIIVFIFILVFGIFLFFSLRFITLSRFFSLLFFRLIRDFFLDILRDEKADGVVNELRVLLNEVLDLLLFNEFEGIILEVEGNSSSTAKGVTSGVLSDSKLTISSRAPDVLIIIVVLTSNRDSVCNQVAGVKTNTELTNHRHVLVTLTHSF